MEKSEALQTMLDNSRAVVDPKLARDIAKSFGYNLQQLGVHIRKTSNFDRLTYSEDLNSVAIYELAKALAEKEKNITVQSMMHGRGSYAEDITKKSVALLS